MLQVVAYGFLALDGSPAGFQPITEEIRNDRCQPTSQQSKEIMKNHLKT